MTPTPSTDKTVAEAMERAAFEAWFKDRFGFRPERHDSWGYSTPAEVHLWEAWQARAAAPAESAAMPEGQPIDPQTAAPAAEPEPVVQLTLKARKTGKEVSMTLLKGSDDLAPGTYKLYTAAPPTAAQSDEAREVMTRLIAGVDHLSELARLWEPDHSSGADRRGWVLAKDARDDAVRLLAALQQKG